jgi:hypothetical protein
MNRLWSNKQREGEKEKKREREKEKERKLGCRSCWNADG